MVVAFVAAAVGVAVAVAVMQYTLAKIMIVY